MGELRAVVEGKTIRERLAKALTLTLSVINEGTRQEEETNLVLGQVEVEVGTWELGLDNVFPEQSTSGFRKLCQASLSDQRHQ